MRKWEEVEVGEDLYGRLSYTYYEELSNGQYLCMQFQLIADHLFNCALCIMDTKDECDMWMCRIITEDNINGKCGLEGLSKAYKLIKWFIDNKLKDGQFLKVHGYNKRGKAYRYLQRLGFHVDYTTEDESNYVYEKQNLC